MTRDTSLGGLSSSFPDTRTSAIQGMREDEPAVRRQSYERVVSAYWKPVYKYLRFRGESNENAKDLTQGFFTSAIENQTLTRYDPARAVFRTYLRTCLDGFVLNQRKYARRGKRAGDTVWLPLDFASAEGELRAVDVVSGAPPMEDVFHREWVRCLFATAVDQLRDRYGAAGKEVRFDLFTAYDLNPADPRPTYDQLACRFGITAVAVTNHLAAARRDLRRATLACLRELTATEREFQSEARALFGGSAGEGDSS